MSLAPEPDEEVTSEGEVDEIDLNSYEQDPWDNAEDFLYQQQHRVGACKAYGFLLAGKPGAGKTNLAGKLAAELGAVHVGLPQILGDCVKAAFMQTQYDNLKTQIECEKHLLKSRPGLSKDTAEGAYDADGVNESAKAGETSPGPDEEAIARWLEESTKVLAEWSTLALPKEQFEAAKDFSEAAQLLLAGQAVEGDLLGRLLTARLRCPDVQFRGYVLESLPLPLLPDMLLQPDLPKLSYVLMLELTDSEAMARLNSLQLEPASGLPFSLGDRTPGDHQPLVKKVDADGAEVLDEGQPVMVNETPLPLEKWVKRVQDMPDKVKARMDVYTKMTESDAWRAVLEQLQPGCCIRLDASLSHCRVLASAKQALAFETYPIVLPPQVLQGAVYFGDKLEEAPQRKPLEELFKIVDAQGEAVTRSGARSLSAWGPFCPVALSEKGATELSRTCPAMLDCAAIVDGVSKPWFAAEYCGRVFLLSSPLALQLFCANPLPYVSSPPALPRLRVLIAGPPCAGKTEVAKSIADRYGAMHIDALKAVEREMSGQGAFAEELTLSFASGKGLTPELLTRVLASQLGLPAPDMPAPPPPPSPPRGELVEGGEPLREPEPFVPPVWAAKGDVDMYGVVEWGKSPEGQESLRFVMDGLPLDVLERDGADAVSPAVLALRTAMLVPTVVLILEDSAPEGIEGVAASVGRERTEHAKEAGFFYNLGREAALEREKNVQYPFDEARKLQSAALAPGSTLCTQLAAAGCHILRLDARMKLAELVEAAAARVDPLIYGKQLDGGENGAPIFGASKFEGFMAPPLLGALADDEPEAQGLEVFGHLKNFCPVTWRREGSLVPGRPEFMARWRGLLYSCKGEAELNALLENPAYFAPTPLAAPEHMLNMFVDGGLGGGLSASSSHLYDGANGAGSSASALPPLRLMLLGPLGSDRQKHAVGLSVAHGLHVVNLQVELPPAPPKPPATATEEEVAAAKKEWLPEDLEEMAKALSAKLSRVPLSRQAVLLEGEPLSEVC